MRIDRIAIGNEIRLIENVKISSKDDLIYIYGNAGADEDKISDLDIFDVSDFLADNGWFGQQILLELCGEYESDEHKSQAIRNRLDTSVGWKIVSIAKMSRLEENYKQFLNDWLHSRYVYSGEAGNRIIKKDTDEIRILAVRFMGSNIGIPDIRDSLLDGRVIGTIEISKDNINYLKKQNKDYCRELRRCKNYSLMKNGYKRKSIIYTIKDLYDKFREPGLW